MSLWIAPIMWPILGFTAGIGLGPVLFGSLGWVVITAIVFLIGYLFLRRRRIGSVAFLVCLSAAAGAIHYHRAHGPLPKGHIYHLMNIDSDDRSPRILLTGWIVGPPTLLQPERLFPYHSQPNLRTCLQVQVDEAAFAGRKAAVTGLVEVTLSGMIDRFQPGQHVRIRCRLARIQPPPPGPGFPFSSSSSSDKDSGIFVRASVTDPQDIAILTHNPYRFEAVLYKARIVAQGFLRTGDLPVGENTPALLNAVILGDRYQVQNKLNQAFVQTGSAHFLAVSGFNVAILAVALWFLGPWIGLSERITTIVVVISVIVYAGLANFQPSINRAAIMIIVVCLGTLFNKPRNTLNSLAAAAWIILLINPNQLFNAGFQLSFLATLGLVVLSSPIHHVLFPRPELIEIDYPPKLPPTRFWFWAGYFGGNARVVLCASLAAGLATMPLVMQHFQLVSMWGWLSSLVLVLPVSILTLLGFAQMLVSGLVPPLAFTLGWINDVLCRVLSWLTLTLAKIPGCSFDVPPPSWPLVFGYWLVLFGPFLLRHRLWQWRVRAILFLLLTVVYLSGWVSNDLIGRRWLYVAGESQGQTVVLSTGRDLVFFDCGSARMGRTGELARRLACQTLTRVRLVVPTFPEQAYFNDAWTLAEKNPGLRVLLPAAFNSNIPDYYEPVTRLLSDPALTREFLPAGARVNLNGTQVTLLYPPDDLPDEFDLATKKGILQFNRLKTGAALLVDFGDQKTIVTSVLSRPACQFICREFKNLKIDVLILNTRSETGRDFEELIRTLRPKQVVLAGWPDAGPRRFQELAGRYELTVIEAFRQGGWLLKDP